MSTWHPFNPTRYGRQKLPAERKCVLLAFAKTDEKPAHVAVGYLRYGAGDAQSPYFVIPGIGGVPTHWCDCLPHAFKSPHWPDMEARGYLARYTGKPTAPAGQTESKATDYRKNLEA